MNENTRKILVVGATGLVLVAGIHHPKHDDVVEQDYIRPNTIQIMSAYGATGRTSVLSAAPYSTTLRLK